MSPGDSLPLTFAVVSADFIDDNLTIDYSLLELNTLTAMLRYEKTVGINISHFTAREIAGTVQIDWNGTARGYNLYRKEKDNGNFSLINRFPLGETCYIDKDVFPGTTYCYTITSVGLCGNESDPLGTVTVHLSGVPRRGTYALHQNHPNPFNPSTTIRWNVPTKSRVCLRIFNMMGEPVKTLVHEEMGSGTHTIQWHGRDQHDRPVSSGIYLCRLEAGGIEKSMKMLLLK
jgi:hypothetical protein